MGEKIVLEGRSQRKASLCDFSTGGHETSTTLYRGVHFAGEVGSHLGASEVRALTLRGSEPVPGTYGYTHGWSNLPGDHNHQALRAFFSHTQTSLEDFL